MSSRLFINFLKAAQHKCHAFLFIALIFPLINLKNVSAETFTIRVTVNGVPAAGVSVYGNQGVKNLAGRSTDSNGKWSVDTNDLYSSNFVLAFTHNARALRFEPSELSPSVSICPGRVCEVHAFEDGNPSAVVQWSSIYANGAVIPNMPIVVAGSDVPCPKFTDNDGYVLFAVRKNLSTCNDTDANAANNYYKVVNLQPKGKSCTFSTAFLNKFNVCTNSAQNVGYTTASCSPVADKTVGSSVSYEVQVQQENGAAATGVHFFGVKALESAENDSQGKLKFTTDQIGVSANAQITLIPYGSDFQFQPARLDISPNSCANNVCKITAFRNGSAQGIVRWKVNKNSTALAGVSVAASDFYSCGQNPATLSNQDGYSYFPSIVRANCDITDNSRGNDFMSFNAVLPGCTFTHASQNAFQVCPSQQITDAQMSAYCGVSAPSQYSISGKVYDRDGYPLVGAQIKSAGLIVASSDSTGKYSITVDDQSSPSLEASHQDLVFDPSKVSIDKIARNFTDMHFYAIAPDEIDNSNPDPIIKCEAKARYETSGFIFDEDGSPLPDAKILNNEQEVATSDQFGHYSFLSDPGDDLWVSVDYPDAFLAGGASFDPSARALLDNYCDKTNINFRRISVQSQILYGKVTDSSGQFPIAGAAVTLQYHGITRVVNSDANGEFMHTAPDGEDYTIFAEASGHDFSPENYQFEADRSRFNLDFKSNISYAPTATATATRTQTATPTLTYTPSNTPTLTATYTITNTATVTKTSTRTATPTNTLTPTLTATFTNTATATKTFTASVTATVTKTSTNTATFTITNTPTNTRAFTATATATNTPTATNTATASNTYTPSRTPTITMTPTNTYTETATATPTKTLTPTKTATPSNTPTSTATPNLMPLLTSVCSESPNTLLKWRVTNRKAERLSVAWEVYGTIQTGRIEVGAFSEVYFESVRILNNSNTVRIFVNNQQVDVKASGFAQCVTPTSTATSTPTDAGDGEGEHHAQPTATSTATPSPSETYTPVATATATPLPEEWFVLKGSLKDGANGKALSSAAKKRLAGLNIIVLVKRLDGDRLSYTQTLQNPFNFELSVTKGTYNISIESEGRLSITSLPRKFQLNVKKNQSGINFGIRLRNPVLVN